MGGIHRVFRLDVLLEGVAKTPPAARAVFLVVGLTLLTAAAYAYEWIVREPRTWPHRNALVVSSRVISPRTPSQYSPELVLQLDESGSTRTVLISPRWSSSSYTAVEAHVGRFPAGERVTVAVNPRNPSDVRYDLTSSMANLAVPAVLGLLGLFFTSVGFFAGRGRDDFDPEGGSLTDRADPPSDRSWPPDREE